MNGLGKAQARVNLLGQHEVARDVMILGTKHQPACGRPVPSFDDLGTKKPGRQEAARAGASAPYTAAGALECGVGLPKRNSTR
jgi:hypothetical protein